MHVHVISSGARSAEWSTHQHTLLLLQAAVMTSTRLQHPGDDNIQEMTIFRVTAHEVHHSLTNMWTVHVQRRYSPIWHLQEHLW